MRKIKEKLRSKVVWLTAIPVIINLIAIFCPNVADTAQQVLTSIVTLLALFGILNNPDVHDEF